jgi:hypothetical protein
LITQMARFSRATTLLVAAAMIGTALPAAAQFESIFGPRQPPRPPADVPSGRAAPNNFPPPSFEPDDDPRMIRRAPAPAQTPPPPLQVAPVVNAPPTNSPRNSGIRSEPLPPPPGGNAAPIEAGAPPQSPGNAASAPKPGSITPVQPTPGGNATPPSTEAALPPEETVVEPPAQRIANPTAVFAGLDKITGRITSFEVGIGETVQFGALQVTPRACYSRPPTETARTDAFLQVDEVTLQGEVRRIFTGWMFAASPGLHAVEHPIYDIWLTDCKGGSLNVAGADDKTGAAAQAAKPPARSTAAPTVAAPRRR